MSAVADQITDSITEHAVALARVPNEVLAVQSVSLATMGGLLQMAIERGLSPEAIEKLVNLHERLQKADAERQFNHAIQMFQSRCPTITHSREADTGKFKYTYAEMPHIAATIKPFLDELGLSYSFDSSMDAGRMKATCTVHHVAGHSRAASFEAELCGSPAMNSIQKTASTVTYGKRQALLMALGISTADTDDDGRSWNDPSPKPDVNGSSPRVAPRAQRATVVTKAQRLNDLFDLWNTGGDGTKDQFAKWAASMLQRDGDFTKLSEWKDEEITVCERELQ